MQAEVQAASVRSSLRRRSSGAPRRLLGVAIPTADEEHADYTPTFAGLKKMKTKQLKAGYDEHARNHNATQASFYLDEIHRRESRRRERWMLFLTVVIAVLTGLALYAVWSG